MNRDRADSAMNQDSVIIRCPACGIKNRIPPSRLNDRPLCGKCRQPLPVKDEIPTRPVEIDDGNFEREVLSFEGAVLLDCWAPWCGPCRTLAPILEQLASEYAGRIKVGKLNVDHNPLTASRYGIQGIPTLLLFRRGELVDRVVGALPKQEIEKHLQALL